MVMMMIPTNLAETDEGKQQWDFLSHPNSWAALASMAPLSSPAPSSSSSSVSPPSSSGPSPSDNLPSATVSPTSSPSFPPSSPPAQNSASILSYCFITVFAARMKRAEDWGLVVGLLIYRNAVYLA
ncbi:hypothetical protein SUGI_0181950 [Cryptomeria japonica]|nr:hypothetical protein SUGI_0181950 [Cryptomeria japonica]